MAISINICNLALGELRAGSITDINEDSVEAANCGRFYPQCLKLLLERYEWSFATALAALALLTDNPRSSEWLFAYALPANMANAKRLVPPDLVPLITSAMPSHAIVGHPYIIEAGVLYSQVPGAVLEYSINDLDESVMPAMFIDALTYALAARLAVPTRDQRQIKGELLQQAEVAVQRAIADDANRQSQRQEEGFDEVALVRGGYSGYCVRG